MEMLHYDAPLSLCGWVRGEERGEKERKQKKADEKRDIGEESGGEGANGETRKAEET